MATASPGNGLLQLGRDLAIRSSRRLSARLNLGVELPLSKSLRLLPVNLRDGCGSNSVLPSVCYRDARSAAFFAAVAERPPSAYRHPEPRSTAPRPAFQWIRFRAYRTAAVPLARWSRARTATAPRPARFGVDRSPLSTSPGVCPWPRGSSMRPG